MTNWWQTEDMFGHLCGVLPHINYVKTSSMLKRTEICRYLFDALNKAWTAFNDFQKEPGRSDIGSLTKLIIEGMSIHDIEEFLQSEELQNLVEFEPNIMNHDTLRRRKYRPDSEIKPGLMREATEEHRQLVSARKSYKESPSTDTKERLLKKTTQLLYIVRSNIAHGEKTPYGPDLKKAERDEKVSSVVIPVQHKLVELIFDKPDRKLLVYGTLAPGSPNERILAGIKGTWQECKVRGKVLDYEGLKYFKWNPNAPEIDAKMFVSQYLPDKLDHIDEFEGSSYHRILIPAKVEYRYTIGNTYEGKDI